MFVYFPGIVDQVMKQLQFEMSSSRHISEEQYVQPPLLGQSPKKKATHFINKDDKFLSAEPVKKGQSVAWTNSLAVCNMFNSLQISILQLYVVG